MNNKVVQNALRDITDPEIVIRTRASPVNLSLIAGYRNYHNLDSLLLAD